MHPRSVDGYILLVTMIALAVLAVIVAAAIQFTGTNRMASVATLQGAQMSSCSESAKRYLLSMLRVNNVSVSSLVLDQQLTDDANASNRKRIQTGHYSTGARASVASVSGSQMSGSRQLARDLTNESSSTTLGGQYFRVTVKCAGASGRESEMEFVFRYGL